ncbi:substrate-binding periplasmic protein [Bdellovibrio sp. HCB209]|uniref:substrate-binding periplasmic protein n=1 Tax=Bdellovibrio sp. HCB209 TaxID=3394354 RepID=UPI0039B41068
MARFQRFVIGVSLLIAPLFAHAEEWVIAVTEWYPYTCESCAGKGPGISAVKKMLNESGVQVKFTFLPWARAVSDTKKNKVDGYYPAWNEDHHRGLIISDSVFHSPIGFIERKLNPLKWDKLEDLRGKTIGVVIDYGNTAEFNALVESGVIKIEEAKDDETNVKKVLGGRLDGAFIDLVNGRYLIAKLGVRGVKNLQINEKAIANKSLHIVFGSEAYMKAERFNKLLRKAKIQKEIDQYLKDHPPQVSRDTEVLWPRSAVLN